MRAKGPKNNARRRFDYKLTDLVCGLCDVDVNVLPAAKEGEQFLAVGVLLRFGPGREH